MKKYWMCYVSGTRCTGPVQVLPNNAASLTDRDYSWVAASKQIEDADVVSFAPSDTVGTKPGYYQSKAGGSVYFITTNLSEATAFVRGARASRATAAAYLLCDAGTVVPLRVVEPTVTDNSNEGADSTEDEDEEDD